MPENEFEKQVQHKMNELRFVPSAAAWNRVEAAIAQKKKRRRLLVWFPLLFLLLGGTAYYFMHQNSIPGKNDRLASTAGSSQTKTVHREARETVAPVKNK